MPKLSKPYDTIYQQLNVAETYVHSACLNVLMTDQTELLRQLHTILYDVRRVKDLMERGFPRLETCPGPTPESTAAHQSGDSG